MTPIETVESFIDAWNRKDTGSVCEAFTDDAVYHNIPMEPVEGKDAIGTVIAGFVEGAKAIDWETHHIAADGQIVLTERTDSFDLVSGKRASVRVMGVFEISDTGKIAKWRDYFDSAEMAREFDLGPDGSLAG